MNVRVVGIKEFPLPLRQTRDKDASFIVDTTSRGRYKELSPFYLGPVELYNGFVAMNMENAWQYSKVYLKHFDRQKQETKPAYFEWAKGGWQQKRAVRYPMGKGAIPLFSYWDGSHLDYIEARKRIYAPLYASLVEKTETYQRMKAYYDKGHSLVLWDFDGYDYQSLGATLEEVINNPNRKMGHAFVLCMMLKNERVWLNGPQST